MNYELGRQDFFDKCKDISRSKYCAVMAGCLHYLYDKVQNNQRYPTLQEYIEETKLPMQTDHVTCWIEVNTFFEKDRRTFETNSYNRRNNPNYMPVIQYSPGSQDNQSSHEYLPVSDLEREVDALLHFLTELEYSIYLKCGRAQREGKEISFDTSMNDEDAIYWKNILQEETECSDSDYQDIAIMHHGDCSGWNGSGCSVCSLEDRRLDALEFIEFVKRKK